MDKKKISYLILLCLFSLSCTLQAEKYETVSPNGKTKNYRILIMNSPFLSTTAATL